MYVYYTYKTNSDMDHNFIIVVIIFLKINRRVKGTVKVPPLHFN